MRESGLGIAAISYDSVEILKSFSDRRHISIPLLSDPDSATIRAFGILNESVPKTSFTYGVPHPLTYIVGPDGRIRSLFREEDYRLRFTTGAILSRAAVGTDREASTNPRVSVSSSSSDAVVRGGERVRLFVTIRLAKKVHIYAPGVKGYKPVDWQMTPAVAAQSMAAVYPKSRMLRLKVIKETVPVFENEVRIYRDVVIGQPKEVEKLLDASKKLRIEGTLAYQACDDRQCFNPEQIPLEWTFRYEPHDSTRAPAELRRK